MKQYLLIFLFVLPLLSPASSVEWKIPSKSGIWRSPDGSVTLRLIKEKEKDGPFYRLQLRRNENQPIYVGELAPDIWIDNSWAGVAWLEGAPYAWIADKVFFQEGEFIAILDVKHGAFLLNNQTEFCQKIGDLRWIYVASRGKNSFRSTDVIGIVGEGVLEKGKIEVPAGFVDKAVINRVGISHSLDGLLLAPPVVHKASIWVIVVDKKLVVKLHQLDLESLKLISTREVTDKIPNLKTVAESTKDGSIPEIGKMIFEGLLIKMGIL